ncbi:MAG: hypothetical protein M3N23_12970 [Pseudomonadota bacterium]|nr:hypothetical protein [Pseudomonadota bacterium]
MTNRSQYVPASHAGYDPDRFLTDLQQHLHVTDDAALSRALHISRGLIAQLRTCRRPMGGALLLRLQEVTSLSVAELRQQMGDRRQKCRMPVRIN